MKSRSNAVNPKMTILLCICIGLLAVVTSLIIALAGVGKDLAEVSSDISGTSSMDTADVSSSTVSQDETSSASSSSEDTSSVTSSQVTSSGSLVTLPPITIPGVDPDSPGAEELVCYLTFDDGPCANTDKILSILKENDVKATFFVVGTMSTGKIKSIYNAGHAIGLHTNTHELSKNNSKYVYKDVNAFINDLKGISDVVYEKTGIRSNLTRFPGGSATAKARLGTEDFEEAKSILKEKGYTYFDWNIDSGDTHSKSPSKDYVMNEIRSGLRKNGELKKEICILMHDIKDVTVDVLPDVIKELKDLGYTFKSLNSNCDNFAFY